MTASDLGTPPVAGQRLTSDDGDYMLLFVEWEKKDDDALVGKLETLGPVTFDPNSSGRFEMSR